MGKGYKPLLLVVGFITLRTIGYIFLMEDAEIAKNWFPS
jgi:hypothetical protein